MFPLLHIMQNSSIQIHTGGMQPRFRRSPGSQHLLVCTGSSSPHPQHPLTLPSVLLVCLGQKDQWDQVPSSRQCAGQNAVQGRACSSPTHE